MELLIRRSVPRPPVGWSAEKALHVVLKILGPSLVLSLNEARLAGLLRGETPQERYEAYVRDLVEDPVPFENRFRDNVQSAEAALVELAGLLERVAASFDADRRALTELVRPVGEVASLDVLGDVHDGVAVVRVTTSEGRRIYWKPGSQRNDDLVGAALGWIHERLGNPPGSPRVPRHLRRDGHLWAEHVGGGSLVVGETSAAYRGAGRLAACAYLLGMTDLHFENVVFHDGSLHVLDCETLFFTRLQQPEYLSLAHRELDDRLMQSTLGSGLLPAGTRAQELGGDVSGLGATSMRLERPQIVDPGTDEMRYERRVVEFSVAGNTPRPGQQADQAATEHADEIAAGLREALGAVAEDCEDFVRLLRAEADGCQVRVLARSTASYAALLRVLASPETQAAQRVMAALRRNSLGLDPRLIESEHRQLREGSIPAFYARVDALDVVDATGVIVARLDRAPLDMALDRIRAVDAAEVSFQESLVRFALTAMPHFSSRNPTLDRVERGPVLIDKHESVLKRAAEDLADRIIDSGHVASDGSWSWAGVTVDDHDQLMVTALAEGVYGGAPGVLRSLQTASRVLARQDLADIVMAQRAWLTRAGRSASGRPSASTWYSGAVGVMGILRDAGVDTSDLSARIAASLDATIGTDVISGAAGGVLGLLGLGSILDAECLLDRLLAEEQVTEAGSLWGDPNNQNVSFAHGGRGIAAALLLGARATSRSDLVEAWRRSDRFNASLSQPGNRWPDRRSPDLRSSANWCHGVTGVVTQRTLEAHAWDMLAKDEAAACREELRSAQSWLFQHYDSVSSISLCHGAYGNLAALWNSRNVPGAALTEDPRRLCAELARWGMSTDWVYGAAEGFHPLGLMTGTPGVLEVLCHLIEGTDVVALNGGWQPCVS